MTKKQLILNRYKPLGKAGAGGFATVQVAWDTRIQRKVAIKCIPLSEAELERAALPGADAIVLPDEEDEARSYGSAMHGMSSGAEPGSAGCVGTPGADVSLMGAGVVGSAAASRAQAAIDPQDIPPWEDLPEAGGESDAEAAPVAAGDSQFTEGSVASDRALVAGTSRAQDEDAAEAWLFNATSRAMAQAEAQAQADAFGLGVGGHVCFLVVVSRGDEDHDRPRNSHGEDRPERVRVEGLARKGPHKSRERGDRADEGDHESQIAQSAGKGGALEAGIALVG